MSSSMAGVAALADNPTLTDFEPRISGRSPASGGDVGHDGGGVGGPT